MIHWLKNYKIFIILIFSVFFSCFYLSAYFKQYLRQITINIQPFITEEIKLKNFSYLPENKTIKYKVTTALTESFPIKLFYWKPNQISSNALDNFGDRISFELVKRVVGPNIQSDVPYNKTIGKTLFAIGSIIHFAQNGDVIWGSGILKINSRLPKDLDVRAVRGPLTRKLLIKRYPNMNVPKIYGDPALLVPYFFPEFKKSINPEYNYTIIPHLRETHLPQYSLEKKNIILPTADWRLVIKRILNSKFVISSSLHGLILAESFGIPARFLRLNKRDIFKYADYYFGTGRFNFKYASSIKQALRLGGEPPFECDLEKLYDAFPREFFGYKLLYDKLPLLKKR